jgi:hypothetical protein
MWNVNGLLFPWMAKPAQPPIIVISVANINVPQQQQGFSSIQLEKPPKIDNI